MSEPLPFDTVLFDVDGTLIDSNGAHAETWAQAFAEHGVAIDASAVRPLVGMGGDKLIPAVARVEEDSALGRAVARRKKALFADRLPQLAPTAGARPLVEFLRARGIELVVATSGDERDMRALLEQAGVADLFPLRTSKDDAAQSKPDPDIVEAALARVRARRASTVMIGDTPYDIEAAGRAGLGTIALRCGGHWSDAQLAGARQIFDDPAALLRHLENSRR